MKLSVASILLIVVMAGLLGGAIWIAVDVWQSMGEAAGGAAAMSGHGIAAIIIGGAGTLALGIVLMGLLFYSNRKNMDR
ncbi:hypothetical protein [Inquilinus sp. CAU 1745]|uniref:hypothetical protein n=1 Tax=Inquilinus sp. CAU 1745 TaxID=3140369 RepID=UPI00325C18A6